MSTRAVEYDKTPGVTYHTSAPSQPLAAVRGGEPYLSIESAPSLKLATALSDTLILTPPYSQCPDVQDVMPFTK